MGGNPPCSPRPPAAFLVPGVSGVGSIGSIMTLRDLIDILESLPPRRPVENGFGAPHSYRGFYDHLAFEPVSHTTVGEMLEAARAAVGTVYEGYHGGEFCMHELVDVYLAAHGMCGEPITVWGLVGMGAISELELHGEAMFAVLGRIAVG